MSYAIPQQSHPHQIPPLDPVESGSSPSDVLAEKDDPIAYVAGSIGDGLVGEAAAEATAHDENKREENRQDAIDPSAEKENDAGTALGVDESTESKPLQKRAATAATESGSQYDSNNGYANRNNRSGRGSNNNPYNNNSNNNRYHQKNTYHNRSYSNSSYQTFQPSYIQQYPRMVQYPVNNGMVPQYSSPSPYSGSYASSSGSSPPSATHNLSRRQSQAQQDAHVNYGLNYSYSQDPSRYSPPPYYMYTPYVPMYQPSPYSASASQSPQLISPSPHGQGYPGHPYNQGRMVYPMQMYYPPNNGSGNSYSQHNNNNRYRNEYDETAVEDAEEGQAEVGIDDAKAVETITMNLLNLPANETTSESIRAIIEEILQEDAKGEDGAASGAAPLPVENMKIYKYTDQELCWCSFQLTDSEKLDLLITKLNGYVFHDSILKCFVQPPRTEEPEGPRKYSYSPQYVYSGYQMNYHAGQPYHPQAAAPPPMAPPMASMGSPVVSSMPYQSYSPGGYGRYGSGSGSSIGYHNGNGSSGSLGGGQRYAGPRHGSVSSTSQYYSTGTGATPTAGGRKYSFSQRSKPLGNNYNSIVFPDLDEQTSGSGSGGEAGANAPGTYYEEEDVIDDNELSTEQLQQFNESRHVSPDRLFIGNIPFNSSYHSLWLFLTLGGEQIRLKELQLKTDSSGLSRGFAVGITDGEEGSREMIGRFNGREFESRKLIVRFDKHNGLIFKSHMKKKLDNLNLGATGTGATAPGGPPAGPHD